MMLSRQPAGSTGLQLLLTGVRIGELRFATPSQFDLERGLWISPSEVLK
jgi:integrase